MPVENFVLGAVVLLFGRLLYWLFVGVAGFLLGAELAQTVLEQQPAWVHLLVGIGAGGVGAVIAIVAQRVGFALAGLFAGGYLALVIARAAGAGDPHVWILAGGLVGALIAALAMDPVLIVLSSAVGAAAIADRLDLELGGRVLVFALSFAVGVGVQSAWLARSKAGQAPPRS